MNLQGRKHILNPLNIRPFSSNSALESALVLPQSEGSDIGCRNVDSGESIEFPGNLSEKSHAFPYMSTSVACVLCDINTRVNTKANSTSLIQLLKVRRRETNVKEK